MNRLTVDKRAQILGCLVEGNSIRATCRMTGAAKNTVTKLLVDVGQACLEYHDEHLRNLPCKRIQVDEIWAFCYARKKNLPNDKRDKQGFGDVWTWTALCADSKLAVSWLVGQRNVIWAYEFMTDLADRLANRVQLTTDGHHAGLRAAQVAFGGEVDFATLGKIYGHAPEDGSRRYAVQKCICVKKTTITGNPDEEHISTSFVERANLTMRMGMRRFTRLTNGFSKKLENLEHAVSLHFMHYNFARIHQTLRVTPAMKAVVTDHVWSLEEIAELSK